MASKTAGPKKFAIPTNRAADQEQKRGRLHLSDTKILRVSRAGFGEEFQTVACRSASFSSASHWLLGSTSIIIRSGMGRGF
jgi:hypothetical protein